MTTPTLALIALLAACPWFDAKVPVTVLTPPAFEELAHRVNKPRAHGLAIWPPCRVYLPSPINSRIACHEYRHCAEGHWHE